MSRIIVPVDFTEIADYGIEMAALVAKKTGQTVTLCHVYEKPVYGFVDLFVDNQNNRKILDAIDEKMSEIASRDYLGGIKLEKLVYSNMELVEILEKDKVKEASMVIMGSGGASGIKEMVIGSNAEKFVRHATIPVLTVKQKPSFDEIQKVVFTSNFFIESHDSYKQIKPIIDAFNADLHLLTVNTRRDFHTSGQIENHMQSFVQANDLSDYRSHVYNDETPIEGVINFVGRYDADIDLIVMATHGRVGINQLVKHSLAEDVVNATNKPIMTFRIPQA